MAASSSSPTNTAVYRAEQRDGADYIRRIETRPAEQLLRDELAHTFGLDRVSKYREDFFKTLNSDKVAFVPQTPITLTIELVNRCNLTCVMCYTDNHKGTKYTLAMDDLQALLDEVKAAGVPAVLVGVGSEALLYKDIRKVLRKIKDAGVMDIFLITNGTLLTEEMSEFLIELQISRLLISLDAATNETFEKIRGKPLLPRIERNIEAFLRARERRNDRLPMLRISFCVQDANKHEQEAFRQKWFGRADYIDFQVLSDFSYVKELHDSNEVSNPRLPNSFGEEKPFCNHPFGYLNVWSNGDISPCCTFYGKNLVFGNIRENSLAEIWHGEKMTALRQEFVTGDINPTCKICLSQRENLISDGLK